MPKEKKLAPIDELYLRKKMQQLREVFPDMEDGFIYFASYCASKLIKGAPSLTEDQIRCCRYLYNGETRWKMVQAYRGLGKTTFTGVLSVFRLIHAPHKRVLIVSAGGQFAKEVATWILLIFRNLEILHFMLPDEAAGDRNSTEKFDIHWLFRGSDKAPSVKCLSIESHIQGSRSDLLIADDIESMKNSATQESKEKIIELTKEFESVCDSPDAEIIYLGTPQFFESIYNGLPARGYTVCIFPARVPTADTIDDYNGLLDPYIYQLVEEDPSCQSGYGIDGSQGKPLCPVRFPDEELIKRETSQGKDKFQLQYMLNTALSDASRYPLKLNALCVAPFSNEQGIVNPIWCNDTRARLPVTLYSNQRTDKLYSIMPATYEQRLWDESFLAVDPAGGGENGDETGYSVIRTLNGYIFVQAIGGIAGGYGKAELKKMVKIAKRYDIKDIRIEDNYGNGAYEAIIKPIFEAEGYPVSFNPYKASGQKEVRIIETLEPYISAHRLVIHPDAIQSDLESVELYPAETKKLFSALYQMSLISRDRDCLTRYDRLDALAGGVQTLKDKLQFDAESHIARVREKEHIAWVQKFQNPKAYRDDAGDAIDTDRGGKILYRARNKF